MSINLHLQIRTLERHSHLSFHAKGQRGPTTRRARFRWKQRRKYLQIVKTLVQNNQLQVLYEESLDSGLFEDKAIVRSAICILQTETNPLTLLEQLPKHIESLTLIQGYESGNKSVKFSDLSEFKQLISLELLGPNVGSKRNNESHLICEIDTPIEDLKYLNLERILIKKSLTQIQKFVKEFNEGDVTFEFVYRYNEELHPLTIVQKGADEIQPYQKVVKEGEGLHEYPMFHGFKNLFFLRIANCDLNHIYWEMFDGLSNLEYLILEKNLLKFIPAFAFYGTPNLKTLSLAHNNLLDIQLRDLAGLLELEYLDLTYNNFSQLSELSLPPFPKLKLANFANNPISVIFSNTFEVMNTTDSLIIGSDDMPLNLTINSFQGLNLLKKLTLINLLMPVLQREQLVGMPVLKELILTGNIARIEFDAFVEVPKLETLILAECNIVELSMDSFMGLSELQYLDLSKNKLLHLPPGIFDMLTGLKELYLNGNQLEVLPRDIFQRIHPKLIRLTDNPWHCSCQMSEWKPVIVNRIKQKVYKPCVSTHDKGVSCTYENKFAFKYVYDNRVAPKCVEPKQFVNWSVFLAMRKLLKCKDYKPKFKKPGSKSSSEQIVQKSQELPVVQEVLAPVREVVEEVIASTVKPTVNLSLKRRLLRKKIRRVQNRRKYMAQSMDNNISNNNIFTQGQQYNNLNSDISNNII